MEAFPTLMVCACLTTTLLNGTHFIKFPVRKRIECIAMASAVAFATLGAGTLRTDTIGFCLAVVAAVVIGCCQAAGELSCISFLNRFPPNALGGWGAGTGFSGVLGAAFFLALTGGFGFSISEVCYLLIPMAPIYFWAYEYLEARVDKVSMPVAESGSKDAPLLEGHSQSATLSLRNFPEAWKCSSDIIMYLVTTYVLQYLIYPSLVDRDTLCPLGQNFFAQHAYTLSWITSSLGGTLARASVAVFQIERIWILIALQVVNVFLWAIEAPSHKLIEALGPVNGYVAILLWMFWCGIIAGCGYGNCVHAFGKRLSIPKNLQELCTTTAFALSNVGIISSMALFGILDHGMLSITKIFPKGCPS